MKKTLSFGHLCVVPNLYVVIFAVKNKWRFIKKYIYYKKGALKGFHKSTP